MNCVDNCAICGEGMPSFSIIPLFEDEEGNLYPMCECCANENFPGWEDDDEEDEKDDE
jgi:formate dehydrogenase maturation protein FdhE